MKETFHPPGLSEKDEPYSVDAGNSLRKKMGSNVALDKIFTPEKMQACQAIVDTAHADFLEDIKADLSIIETEYAQAVAATTKAQTHIREIARLSFTMKARMESIGFIFGFDVTKSLYEYVCALPDYTPASITVIGKHIDVLNTVLKNKIKGYDGPLAKEMLSGLQALVKKVREDKKNRS